MKRCPECRRDYYDDSLHYCLDDGAPLLDGPASVDEPATTILPAAGAVGTGVSSGESKTKMLRNSSDAQIGNSNSIAVLPFVNMSADPENEYFCDGLAEELLNALAKIDDLKVAARTSAFSFKGKSVNINEIGRMLGVKTVLEGSVRKSGNRLRISVQFVNVSDGYHLWSERYDREMRDILDVQDEITLSVVDALTVKLLGQEKAAALKRGTDDTEAYQLYLKGRFYWHKRTAEAVAKGLEFFNKAIEHDPDYAIAYTGVSDSYTLLVVREAITPKEGFAKAKAAAVMALKIDATLAEAYASLGHALLHNWEWEAAERELTKAIEMNPRYPSAHHWYSEYLMATGRFDDAITEATHAQELDPLSLIINEDLSHVLYLARRFDRAVEQSQKTLEMEPNFWISHIDLGKTYAAMGLYAEAVAELHKAGNLIERSSEVGSLLGFTYAMSGDREEARKQLNGLLERSGKDYIPPYHFAIAYIGLGDRDQVFEWLEQAYERHAVDLYTLKVEPMFDILRTDPRFSDLVRRVGLPE